MATSPTSAGALLSRSHTRIEGRPSGIVTSRCSVLPLLSKARIWPLLACGGISYSPAFIPAPPPINLAWNRKRPVEEMAPAFFNISAARGRLAPRGGKTSTGARAGPAPFQPWMNQNPRIRSSKAPSASSFLTAGSDRFHHQAGIGAAEAEAVFQQRLHIALLGDERDEIAPRRALARILEIERRRHDLVAQGQ